MPRSSTAEYNFTGNFDRPSSSLPFQIARAAMVSSSGFFSDPFREKRIPCTEPARQTARLHSTRTKRHHILYIDVPRYMRGSAHNTYRVRFPDRATRGLYVGLLPLSL